MGNLFYERLQKESEPLSEKEKIKDALITLSNWCHKFRYDCKGCPLLDNEEQYDICSLKYYNRFGFNAKSAIDRIEKWERR